MAVIETKLALSCWGLPISMRGSHHLGSMMLILQRRENSHG